MTLEFTHRSRGLILAVIMVLMCTTMVFAEDIACEELFVDIASCIDGDTDLVVDFTLGNAQHLDGIIYTFQTGAGLMVNEEALGFRNKRFDNFFVSPQGDDNYRIRWDTDLAVKGIKMTHTDCVGARYVSFESGCSQGVQCSFHEECGPHEQCVDSFCSVLVCPPCQEAQDHRCQNTCVSESACEVGSCSETGECVFERIVNCCERDSECDDGLACTTDYCNIVTNLCDYGELQCDSLCKEPNGCIVLDHYLSEDEDFFTGKIYNFQKTVSENKKMSGIVFSIVMLIIFVLITVQTSQDRKRFVIKK